MLLCQNKVELFIISAVERDRKHDKRLTYGNKQKDLILFINELVLFFTENIIKSLNDHYS